MRRLFAPSAIAVALPVGASFAHAQSSPPYCYRYPAPYYGAPYPYFGPSVCAGGSGHHFGGRICF